jgi:hypothetical protein
MKSNVCRIENGTKDLAAILNESEKVAEYVGLNHKQSLQLRLLCEELDGMLPNIVDDFEGDLWIEFDKGVCKINAAIDIPDLDLLKKEDLIAVSKNKKNAATVGIVGKIRSVLESFFVNGGGNFDMAVESYYFTTGYRSQADYTAFWSLSQYKNGVKTDEKAEAWDELEKSVIASVADDVIVGVKGKKAEIVIVKKFA